MALNGFVVAVIRDNAQWRVDRLPDGLQADLAGLVAVLHQQGGEGGAIGLIDVADEFFVVVRALPGGSLRLLLSDVTAAVEWDLARQVLDRLGEDPPDEDELDEIWPVGDLGIFTDLGLGEMDLGTILDDLDLYADEMLIDIARRVGFAEPLKAAVDNSVH
ncbi:MAG: tRNA adenosine deaminase-associated protein [Actinomycetota bacterium]|nr:tRNA adenosine deaminase-associated protein [Actinomycetota bacterium]